MFDVLLQSELRTIPGDFSESRQLTEISDQSYNNVTDIIKDFADKYDWEYRFPLSLFSINPDPPFTVNYLQFYTSWLSIDRDKSSRFICNIKGLIVLVDIKKLDSNFLKKFIPYYPAAS